MAEEQKKIHCLHVCGHIEAMMEEKAEKQFEEKMQARIPIQCSTGEDSGQLHELYKDKVKGTQPSEEKAKMIQEMMEAIEHAKLKHSMTILRAKEEEHGLKRHPSTLSHMNHDDSDSEPEVEDFPDQGTDESPAVTVEDATATDESPAVNVEDATATDESPAVDVEDVIAADENPAYNVEDVTATDESTEAQATVNGQLETDAEKGNNDNCDGANDNQ